MSFDSTVAEVAETLKNAKANQKGCSLLIGAGCSVTAGIPTAQGFVEAIAKEFPAKCKHVKERTYPKYMDALFPEERRALVQRYIDKSKINWTHICVALLIKEGYVDRVLTTNFDPLVAKACALFGEFPAIYDVASSKLVDADVIHGKAVFHLHGQHTGFILINTEDDFKRHSGLIEPVFQDAGKKRAWIVIGYSGENDPVFHHLADVKEYKNGLYWVGYQNNEPAKHVSEKLLIDSKYAHFIKGYDSDSFFVELTQRLNIFPPDIIDHPFSYLKQIFDLFTPFKIPTQESEQRVTAKAMEWINKAIEDFEVPENIALEAQNRLMAGEYDEVIKFSDEYERHRSPELAYSLSWAYIMRGNELYNQAKLKTGGEADRLFEEAGKKYESALKVKPDKHEALNNWGLALSDQAKLKTGAEAERLFEEAGKKYEAALKLKPDKHEALNNWGILLRDRAKLKTGAEAERLFEEAGKKYEAALKIKPDKHEALNNWGIVLSDQAKLKTGAEAERLFEEAGKKYEAALKLKPDQHEALNNWGITLSDQAKLKTGAKSKLLFVKAREKCLQAEQIQSGVSAYDLACISALLMDEKECQRWLEVSLVKDTLPTREHLNKDTDLDSVRESKWFKDFMNKVQDRKPKGNR